VWLARAAAGACVVAVMLVMAGCGEAPNPPVDFVQNYLNALGGGEYATACGLTDSQALEALMRAKHARPGCAGFFKRCLPNRSIVLKSDQTQLLYANINVTLSGAGKIANADTSGTPVATELKHVALKHEQGVWKLTGFGQAIEACHLSAHRRRHKPGNTAKRKAARGARTKH
jgi:hypothetical protein